MVISHRGSRRLPGGEEKGQQRCCRISRSPRAFGSAAHSKCLRAHDNHSDFISLVISRTNISIKAASLCANKLLPALFYERSVPQKLTFTMKNFFLVPKVAPRAFFKILFQLMGSYRSSHFFLRLIRAKPRCMADLKTEKRGVRVQIESFKGRTNKQKHNHTHAQKCSFDLLKS